MNIGEKISALRRRNGWSQDVLAGKIGVSRQSISKWESGKVIPDSDRILTLSKVFEVSTDILLKEDEVLPEETQKEPEIEEVADIPITAEENEVVKIDAESEEKKDETTKEAKERKPFKWSTKKIVAVIVAACLLITAIVLPFPLGLYKNLFEKPVQYPYVLVHGLGGWGEASGINDSLPYWGATAGSLKDYLTEEGYSVYEASVGPFSSCWDRACELYAQLTGTTVDYGVAHSAAHNHERYGRTYDEPLFENWGGKTPGGQLIKINLVGHSFGGPTVRLLTHLLENGAPEELEASGDDTSPLFTGEKGNWVNSVTALCSPNNGSTLVYVLDNYKASDLMLNLCLTFAGLAGNSSANGFYDFQLEQFGITQVPGEATDLSKMGDALKNIFNTGTDNALYDLSLDGAAKLNERIELVDDVYYFSYAYCTTSESSITKKQVPTVNTLTILKTTALLMGRYSKEAFPDIELDKTWLENDGLVNVVSAKYPFDEKHKDYNAEEKLEKGIWNVMPVMSGDHGTVIGLNTSETVTHKFYDDLCVMIDAIERDRKIYVKSPFSKNK